MGNRSNQAWESRIQSPACARCPTERTIRTGPLRPLERPVNSVLAGEQPVTGDRRTVVVPQYRSNKRSTHWSQTGQGRGYHAVDSRERFGETTAAASFAAERHAGMPGPTGWGSARFLSVVQGIGD